MFTKIDLIINPEVDMLSTIVQGLPCLLEIFLKVFGVRRFAGRFGIVLWIGLNVGY